MGKYSREEPKRHRGAGKAAALLAVVLVLGLALAGMLLLKLPERSPAPQAASLPPAPEASEPSEAPGAAEAAPDFVPVASGGKEQVRHRASYTAPFSQEAGARKVATAGTAVLTNEALQILYLSQVNAYRAAGAEPMPDFSRPLEYQQCPLDTGYSWQQYFLRGAVGSWYAQQAVLYAAAQPQKITEKAFLPDQTDNLHEKYIDPALPVNNFLYQDTPCYQPNSLHQAYLDGLEAQLDALAQAAGYQSLADMAQRIGASAADWVQAARDYNTAYMYFTQVSYALEPNDGAVSAYLRRPDADIQGSTAETVDIRHILLVPQGASVAEDGTVTATPEQWEATRQEAEALQSQWKNASHRSTEAEFAQLASEVSQDQGSRLDGGYYFDIHQGQLIAPLDQWCFANGRKRYDSAVLQTELGYHLVLISDFRESSLENAKDALSCSLLQEQWLQWLNQVPLEADYSAVALWADTTLTLPTLEDTLYPDIGHQRFPEVMVYLQQDYFYYPFGDREIGKNGCGITAFAMLATYMTDTLETPPMMADRFLEFFDYPTHATNGDIFVYAPAELGFYYQESVSGLEPVIAALQQGQVVISRQQKGHFTSSGHFLVLTGYNAEDDTFQVRDSNIYNYGSKAGHRTDSFTRANILSGGGHFYIMQPKPVRIPACARCGTDFAARQPELLFREDYTCQRCAVALDRREHFLEILSAFSNNTSIEVTPQ